MSTNQQDDKHWQDTLKAVESVKTGKVVDAEFTEEKDVPDSALLKNQKLLQVLGGIISISSDGSANYKQDVQRYLDEKFG